jgi:hypothetical protein
MYSYRYSSSLSRFSYSFHFHLLPVNTLYYNCNLSLKTDSFISLDHIFVKISFLSFANYINLIKLRCNLFCFFGTAIYKCTCICIIRDHIWNDQSAMNLQYLEVWSCFFFFEGVENFQMRMKVNITKFTYRDINLEILSDVSGSSDKIN